MASFVEAFDKLDPRAQATRLRIYAALINWEGRLDVDDLPSRAHLVAESGISQSTLYRVAGEEYQLLQRYLPAPPTESVVRRFVQEAKELTARPWIRGWQDQTAQIRLKPQLKAETLVQVCAAWAQRYRRLAAMDHRALPKVIREAARSCFEQDRDRPAPGMAEFLTAIQQAGGFATDSPFVMSSAGLDHVRAQLAEIRFDDEDLEQNLIRAYRTVAEYMLLARGRHHEANPILVDLLERAAEELRHIETTQPDQGTTALTDQDVTDPSTGPDRRTDPIP